MAFVINELSGSLFKNDRKTKESQPDYTGNCRIEDVEYWVSGWIKPMKTREGKWLSLAFTKKEAPATTAGTPAADSNDFDDDIPF